MDNLDTVKTVHFVHGQDKPGVSCQEKLCTYFETEKRKKKKKKHQSGKGVLSGILIQVIAFFYFSFGSFKNSVSCRILIVMQMILVHRHENCVHRRDNFLLPHEY